MWGWIMQIPWLPITELETKLGPTLSVGIKVNLDSEYGSWGIRESLTLYLTTPSHTLTSFLSTAKVSSHYKCISSNVAHTLISVGIEILVAGVSPLIYDFWMDFATGVYETRNPTGNLDGNSKNPVLWKNTTAVDALPMKRILGM